MTRLIDVDVLPRHGNRGGIVQWHDIEKAPTVDAIPIEWIDQFVDKNRGYISRVTITWLLDDWRAEQRRQNESTG